MYAYSLRPSKVLELGQLHSYLSTFLYTFVYLCQYKEERDVICIKNNNNF